MKIILLNKGCFAFILGVLLCSGTASAYSMTHSFPTPYLQSTVRGIVSDSSGPLSGVVVTVKGTSSSAITDKNGYYTIPATSGDTLVFSFLGYKDFEQLVDGNTYDIQMAEDTTLLQEVTINAGYYSVKDKERTGSISRITSKDIENQPVSNILATMQGRMAGVSVTQTTGVPGGGFDIRIRGQNSIRADGNAPLYIIDGVPYASDPIGYNQTATTFPALTSPLNSISPDNIESIEVLKDADATAIYGSRGANGVVLITTKKGKAGKARFTLNASTGSGRVTRLMKLMNTQQYLDMRREAHANDGYTEYPEWAYDINGTWDPSRYTDWQKELIGGTAETTDFQGTVSGGSETTQYLLSGNYGTQTTVFPGDFIYKKGGSQLNVKHRSDDGKFTLSASAGYTSQANVLPSTDFTYEARALPPNAPSLYDEDGNLNWADGTWDNPLRNLESEYKATTNDFMSNVALTYNVLPELSFKGSFGYTDLNHSETRTSPSTMYNPAYGITSASSGIYRNDTGRSSWIVEPQVNWTANLDKLKIDVLAGATFQNQATARLFQSGTGFSSNNLIYDLASATNRRVLVSDETHYRYQAFFGRANFNLNTRYIVNLTARRDGSSRFGSGNRFASFGAVGATWVFSNEEILNGNSVLSFGKLRGSYGVTGNDQIGDYQYLNTFASSGLTYGGVIGLQPVRLYNPQFGWETNRKLELAIDTGFLKDRIQLSAAWYRNRSSNQLVGVPLPGTTGFNVLQSNLEAEVRNTGLEFTLNTINIETPAFSWTTSFNLSFSKNKLVSFPGLEGSTYKEQYRLGQPLNIQLTYKYLGLDSQTGTYTFEDVNGDGQITFPDDRQTVVDLNPEFFGGLQNRISYKGFKLDFLLHFVKQKNRTYPMGFAGQMSNQPARMVNRWQESGDTRPYQLYTTGFNDAAVTAEALYSESDASIVDASFIRLKNISISYDLPLSYATTKCTLILQAQNLLTLTSYEDGDPEFTSYGYLPPLKMVSGGVQLTF